MQLAGTRRGRAVVLHCCRMNHDAAGTMPGNTGKDSLANVAGGYHRAPLDQDRPAKKKNNLPNCVT